MAGSPAREATAISLQGQIKQETDIFHAQDDLVSSATGNASTDCDYRGMAARGRQATTILAGLMATAANWDS